MAALTKRAVVTGGAAAGLLLVGLVVLRSQLGARGTEASDARSLSPHADAADRRSSGAQREGQQHEDHSGGISSSQPGGSASKSNLRRIEQADVVVELSALTRHIEKAFDEQLRLFERSSSKQVEHEALELNHVLYETPFDVRIIESYGQAALDLKEPCVWTVQAISFFTEEDPAPKRIHETYGCNAQVDRVPSLIERAPGGFELTFERGGTLSFKTPF